MTSNGGTRTFSNMKYTTIEADVENGVLKGVEVGRLPPRAHVLVTLLQTRRRDASDWEKIRPLLGTLSKRADTQEWQKKVRDDWS